MTKRWIETDWGDGGMVEFSLLSRSWEWTCSWGCHGWDHEGEREALDAFLNHDCTGRIQ